MQFVSQLLSQTKWAAGHALTLRVCNLRIFKSLNCSCRLCISSDTSHLRLRCQSHLRVVLSLRTSLDWFNHSSFDTALLVLIYEFDIWWWHKFTLMRIWALQRWLSLSNCFTRSMNAIQSGLLSSHPRCCWLGLASPRHGALSKVADNTTASSLGSSALTQCPSDYLSLLIPNLIYTFTSWCLLFLASFSCSSHRTRLIQQQSANVPVDGDRWLLLGLLAITGWLLHNDNAFLRTLLQRGRSCCFAELQSCVLVLHFWLRLIYKLKSISIK